MKPKSSFFLTRWWREAALQQRLLVVFTALFVYCVVMLSVFLFMAVRQVGLQAEARRIFEQNQRINVLNSLTSRFELAINHYEVAATDRALVDINALSAQIDDQLILLQAQLPVEEAGELAAFKQSKANLQAPYEELLNAVDTGDGELVNTLDVAVYTFINEMYDSLDTMMARGWQQVEGISQEQAGFEMALQFSLAISLPVFLLLAGLMTLVVYGQINKPLGEIGQAAKDLLAGKFKPEQLGALAAREDEMGMLAREFIEAAGQAGQRAAQLSHEARQIRGKIR